MTGEPGMTRTWCGAGAAGAGVDAAQRTGEVCRRADDRRAPADHRRPRAAAQPLHRARTRAQPVAEETQTGAARPTTPQDHRRDRLLVHKQAVFDHLTRRWRDLFNISYDVLLYDLTSTYFEADPPFPEGDKRRYGYSRDHRPDCVQIVIALVVTPEGLPLAYEVLPGNTADKTTLRGFLERIERQYGKARRCIIWWARQRVA